MKMVPEEYDRSGLSDHQFNLVLCVNRSLRHHSKNLNGVRQSIPDALDDPKAGELPRVRRPVEQENVSDPNLPCFGSAEIGFLDGIALGQKFSQVLVQSRMPASGIDEQSLVILGRNRT